MGRISNVGPTTLRSPVPMKKGVFVMCSRVTCKAVAMPVVMKAVDTKYSVMPVSKWNAPDAMASGGDTIDPIMQRACWRPRRSVRSNGTLSLSP